MTRHRPIVVREGAVRTLPSMDGAVGLVTSDQNDDSKIKALVFV
jgi:hypothetical protein